MVVCMASSPLHSGKTHMHILKPWTVMTTCLGLAAKSLINYVRWDA